MQNVNYLDVISEATRQMSRGRALLTVGGDSPNTMTIAWGSIGYCWNRPVFTVYVRPCRHTHDILCRILFRICASFHTKCHIIYHCCHHVLLLH